MSSENPTKPANVFVLELLRDLAAAGKDVTGATVLRHLNDGIRDLGQAGAFRRTELLRSLTKSTYPLATRPVRIFRVRWDGARLPYRTEDQLDVELGAGWRGDSGTPEAWTGDTRVHIAPAPASTGDAVAVSPGQSSALSAQAGYRITGHDYWLWLNGSTEFWFLPEDGRISNADSGTGMIQVVYAYAPEDAAADTALPIIFLKALRSWVLGALLEAFPGGERALADYAAERERFAGRGLDPSADYGHYQAIQDAIAAGKPLPPLLLEEYEKVVHQALSEGDLAGKGFSLGYGFLLQVAQAATAKGRAVPKVVYDALATMEHDVSRHSAQIAMALDFPFLSRFIRDATADHRPIPKALMDVFLQKQKALAAGPRRVSHYGEVY